MSTDKKPAHTFRHSTLEYLRDQLDEAKVNLAKSHDLKSSLDAEFDVLLSHLIVADNNTDPTVNVGPVLLILDALMNTPDINLRERLGKLMCELRDRDPKSTVTDSFAHHVIAQF